MAVATAALRATSAGKGDSGDDGCSKGVGDSIGCDLGGSEGEGAGDSNSFGDGCGNGCSKSSCLVGILVLPNRMIIPVDLRWYDLVEMYCLPVGMVRLTALLQGRGWGTCCAGGSKGIAPASFDQGLVFF
jgi:hypothetical protein